jgi:hypothetical protein
MPDQEMTFEEFNQAIDTSHDEGCPCCFSFHHYAHLDSATRKVAYFGFIDDKPKYIEALVTELEAREKDPIDDNIYWLMGGAELLDIPDLGVRDRIMVQVCRRANEMVQKKMRNAWVGVRAYAWMKNMDPIMLVGFLDDSLIGYDLDMAVEPSKDVLRIWQVVLQSFNFDIVRKEKALHEKSLCLAYMRRKVYDYTLKALELGDESIPYVVAVNGITALASLQDSRVLGVMDKLPRHVLDNKIKESAECQIKYLTKMGEIEFVPVLEQLMQKCQNKL